MSVIKENQKSIILKLCIFATGLAGIVAEYLLATLASYLIGDSVLQWALIISLMLFAMGIGSRLSRFINKNLLESFIFIEFGISLLCSISTVVSYFLSIYLANISIVIYSFCIAIGILIGLEVPIVTRINENYEELKVNIATVMEKDYLGALIGGLFFAFIALPYLGLTYTPIILGTINFLVACLLLFKFSHNLKFKKLIFTAFGFVLFSLISLFIFVKPIIIYSEQKNYRDTIIFQKQSPYQKIVITKWKDYYWLFLNNSQQFSSFDEDKYHEPLVHPAMKLLKDRKKILILGGGDGLAVRELLKYPDVEEIVIVDLDPVMTKLAQEHTVLTMLNKNSMNHEKVRIINKDAYKYLTDTMDFYNLIIVDLPDPKTVELSALYSIEFYSIARRHLVPNGIIVTQATSPIFSEKAFWCIAKTIEKAGFTTLPYHNQIPTLGQWGWVLGVNSSNLTKERLKKASSKLNFDDIQTKFINNEAMNSMINFGKSTINIDELNINSRFNAFLYNYYKDGRWDMY